MTANGDTPMSTFGVDRIKFPLSDTENGRIQEDPNGIAMILAFEVDLPIKAICSYRLAELDLHLG
jgi:hypothetical protein